MEFSVTHVSLLGLVEFFLKQDWFSPFANWRNLKNFEKRFYQPYFPDANIKEFKNKKDEDVK